MSGRKPKPDELELWAKVTQTAQPLPKAFAPTAKPPVQAPQPQSTTRTDFREISMRLGSKAGQKPNDLTPDLPTSLRAQPVKMDQKAFKRMRQGKLKPEGRIDLHGMTLDRAHSALTRFILSSHTSGKRLVLVITGKGKHRDTEGPIPVRFGVLRHQVPEWLRLAPLSSAVLQVTEAHISHGGGGAYYVYLRRAR